MIRFISSFQKKTNPQLAVRLIDRGKRVTFHMDLWHWWFHIAFDKRGEK